MAKIDFEKYRKEREESLKIQWRFPRYDDDAKQLKKLYGKLVIRGANYSKSSSSRISSTSRNFRGWNPESDKQFVMVKMRYSDKLDSHNKFLQEYMTQQNKEEVKVKPVVFSTRLNPFSNSGQRKVVYGQEAVEDYKSCMTGRHYKFIISPDSSKVPMEEFTTAFMHRMQAELGVRLDWVAAVHTDTGHPHVHILINGSTADGFSPKRLFRKEFVSHRCRIIASDIVTDMIGVRSAEQKRQSLDKSFTALRWTNHDKLIAEHTKDGVVIAVNEQMRKRLNFLTTKGLVSFSGGKYKVEKKWDEILIATGRYNSFFEAYQQLQWSSSSNLELFSGIKTIRGKVTKTYRMDDEWQNNNAIVVEDEKGRAWFVPLFNAPPPKLEGKYVKVKNQSNAKGLLVPMIRLDKEGEKKQKAKEQFQEKQKNKGR